MKRSLSVVFAVMAMVGSALAQSQAGASEKTIAERLGYARDAKLLIVHADDLAVAHSVNDASTKALDARAINSASIMIPCAWLPEIADYARNHPDADLGLHLTLTSEWKIYRWGPVLSKERVPSLFATDGYLHPTVEAALPRIDPREAEAEIRAQVERAKAFGIKPTHLDSHMGTLYSSKPMFEVILKVGRENGIPVMIAREWFAQAPFLPSILQPSDVVIDRVVSADPSVTPDKWNEFYTNLIKGLQPGVTELIVHLANDDSEMRAVTLDHPDWGSGWRQRDFDFVMSPAFKKLLEENNVRLVTWREIGKLTPQPGSAGK
jgi:chitin disaccharide deacetylase